MVSVIIALYNKEKEIGLCIKSIQNQTYPDLEIIIVNDGSTDGSRTICESYQKKDSRIRLINKRNEGLEMGRRTGLESVNGDYVCFVDGDDYLPSDAIHALVERINEENAEVCVGQAKRVMGKYSFLGKADLISPMFDTKVISQSEFMENYFDSFAGWAEFPVNLWGKLYRAAFLKALNTKAVGIYFAEDLCFNMQVLPEAKKIVTLNQVVYYYRWGGMTTKLNPSFIPDACLAYQFKKEMIQKYGMTRCYDEIAVELVNIYATDIDTAIVLKKMEKQDAIAYMEKRMADPFLQEVIQIPKYPWFTEQPHISALKSKNAEAYWQIKKKILLKTRIRNGLLRNVASLIK